MLELQKLDHFQLAQMLQATHEFDEKTLEILQSRFFNGYAAYRCLYNLFGEHIKARNLHKFCDVYGINDVEACIIANVLARTVRN